MCEERAGKFFPARLLYFFMIFHFAAVVLQQIFHAAAERFKEILQKKNRKSMHRKKNPAKIHGNSGRNTLTSHYFYDTMVGRMEEHRSFFYAQNYDSKAWKKAALLRIKRRWKLCVQKLHWHARNASSAITT